jgi:hypothetical protein
MDTNTLGMAGLMLGSSILNSVSMKHMTNAMPNYTHFLSFVHVGVLTVLFFGIVFFKLVYTNHITPSMRRVCWGSFIIMGLLDSLAGVMVGEGGFASFAVKHVQVLMCAFGFFVSVLLFYRSISDCNWISAHSRKHPANDWSIQNTHVHASCFLVAQAIFHSQV